MNKPESKAPDTRDKVGFTIAPTNLKANIALAGYWLAVALLTACVVVIVLKLLFWPLCAPAGPTDNKCIMGDSWTIAGVTAAVLGVAAAMLTILGAFAVASWWSGWRGRVEEQVNERVEALYTAQKEEVKDQVGQALQEQKTKVDELVKDSHDRFDDLKQKSELLEGRVIHANEEITRHDKLMGTVAGFVFVAAMGESRPYREVKQFAETTIKQAKADFPQLIVQIALLAFIRANNSLRSTLDNFDAVPEQARDSWFDRFNKQGDLSDNPYDLFNELLNWRKSLDEMLDSDSTPRSQEIVTFIEQADKVIAMYRPRVEAWNNQYNKWNLHRLRQDPDMS